MTFAGSSGGVGRRFFIKCLALGGLLAGVPSMACSAFITGFPIRTVEIDQWSFDPASGELEWKSGRREPYRLRIDGLIQKPVELSYADLRGFPLTEQVSDFHCVEGWSVYDVRWKGFRFSEIMSRVEIRPEAEYVVFHAIGETRSKPKGQAHYIETFPVAQLLKPKAEIILALDLGEKPLSHAHGAPLRVVAPYDLGYKSIKFVERIEFSDKYQEGWWTLANPIYPAYAPVSPDRLRDK